MTIHGSQSRHWTTVGQRFLTDAVLIFLSFYAASVFRFSTWQPPKFSWYLPNVLVTTALLPSIIYIFGLYATESLHQSRWQRFFLLSAAFMITISVTLAYGSLDFTARLGRGVLIVALVFATGSVWVHHFFIQVRARRNPSRMAFLLTSEQDELEMQRLLNCGKPQVAFTSIVTGCGYTPKRTGGLALLGPIESTSPDVLEQAFDHLICNTSQVKFRAVAYGLRNLRYRGINVISQTDAFEELYQFVPLETIDESWLLQVSALPGAFYVRKLKRAFDVVAALSLLLLLGPICLTAMLIIRLSGTGPVIFRQERVGRFRRKFMVIKLRTMRTDAEAAGAQWAKANDSRVTWFGRFLRKYRIDEIPQLINVLRGDMSFVGPRPEQSGIAEQLEQEIPLFSERLMLQPGITGWAQVRYPYGSTVEDARRKLEHDLYYLKHMSLFLDALILLDTIRTVIRGVRFSSPAPMAPLCEAEAVSEH